MTEDTLIEKYGANVNRKQLEIKKVMRGNSSEQIYVFFLENLRFGMADINDYIKRMANDSVHKAIFVVQSNVTSFLRRFINESTHYQLEVFLEAELLINITEHVLVPEHRVLTAEQKKTLLERYTIKEEQIPRIYITDPVARYYGLKHGQVVQIIRPSETAGRYCNYRTAKWWFSAFHNVTAIVGAGVLGLPYTMSELGWGPGVAVLVISWIVTLYSLWQMVEMHEMDGRRFDRYHELGQYAFGEKLGLWIVVPLQLMVEVGTDIVYMVTGGQSLNYFHNLVCKDCPKIKISYFIMIFASVHFVLSQLPSFNSISGVSLAAAVMSFSYSTIAWAASLNKGVQPHVEYGYKSPTPAGTVFNFFNGLGAIVFAYGGHNVVMEIQATMPSTADKPSKGPMWKGVIVAYIVIAVCYLPVAVMGYWIFGNSVKENILHTLEKPTWIIAMANMFVVVHLIGSYQIYAIPVFDMIESVLVKKMKFKPTWKLRFISRNTYVALTMFLAITFPFFNALLGFVGGFAFAPTTYFLPCIIWLAIKKPRRFSLSWFTNWVCIVFGLGLMITAPIGGLRMIILEAKTYHFYT